MSRLKFLRRNTTQYLRIGKKRKKIQKWRKPKGRDNKMRLKRKGYPRVVKVGYKKPVLSNQVKIIIYNLNELKKVKANEIAILGKVGNKKKIEIAKFANDHKIKFLNLNIKKVLKNEK